ncbi:MAG TPA: CHRD domain-containing protein [Thermoanaerobaculia bacterium]|nr:CHRD domain-containing protein [Thermoanaerobaculia bacterium]
MPSSIRVLSLAVLLLLATVSFAQPATVTLTAALNGANERPNPGDADGVGFAVVTFDRVANTVTYSLVSQGIAAPVAAHIHRGTADVAGPVIIDFAPTFTNGAATGSVGATNALINEVISNPGAFYVNIHTPEFPGGAIRGQLGGPGSSAVVFGATLNGANERPTAGDPDGSGFAIVRFDRNSNTVHYALVSQDIGAPVAAHIHRGTADVAGPVVVDFHPTFVAGAASGSVTADSAIITEILGNPAGFYVNIHNAEYPGGAIRGQLVGVSGGATDVVIPIAGRAPGANGTFYRTDLALLNTSAVAVPVVLEWYPTGSSGAPAASGTLVVAAGEEANLFGDQLQNTLGVGNGIGAIRIVATRAVAAVARIYNDQRTADGGTFSQFVAGQSSEDNRTTGSLPMLANQAASSGSGYRTNIGWFNGSGSTASATFRVHGPDGTVLETATRDVPAGEQLQLTLNGLFPTLAALDSVYVTFSTTGSQLYVYASVVDNVNGDAIFIPAQER